MIMRNYRRFKRMLTEDFLVYLRAADKKSLPRQVSEIYQLYKLYGYLPYQYLKHGLYQRRYGKEIYRYFPTELLHIARDTANAAADVTIVEDKLLFEEKIRAANLRTTNTVFRLRDRAIADMAGKPFAYADFVAAVDAMTLPDGIIVKPLTGGSGSAVFKLRAVGGRLFHKDEALDEAQFNHLIFTTNNGFYWTDFIVQETISQHPEVARFNPTSVNTIRIDTFVDATGTVHFNTAALKVGMPGSIIDNSGIGGYMIAIDIETGRLLTGAKREPKFGGQYYDVRTAFGIDPATFVMPFWPEVRETAKLAALTVAPFRSLGWDIAITPAGPLIVEANADYGIEVLQELSGGYVDKALGRSYLDRHPARKERILEALQ
ncbi:sugar-transfer associated ATP-grasp domain-containing protein [Shinella sp.]|uniref:sugar-transfer associated ATP-grasp domain-containing protein n=1 Tax=Shinella sp. TaxID=1870904 RepID=UPI0029A1239F|nr:sugar-transfer associated ATP-grasp domain-containing protein [Shinella sp.]MDX3973958.1 sugar-transfer associated ATP-grasp domain-containing protein [Shinella sp.]